MATEIKHTPTEDSYWNHCGAYEKEYNELFEKLVPSSGDASTVHGELLRCISKVYYDFFNNGNCNAVETKSHYETEYHTCNQCQGSGVESEWGDDDEEIEVECSECCGSGEEEVQEEYDGETTISYQFKDYIDVIEKYAPNSSIEELKNFMVKRSEGDDPEAKIYDKIIDEVMFQILSTENKDI